MWVAPHRRSIMKKFISIASTVLILCCFVCLFAACKDKEAVVDSYSIENKTYTVGDTFSTSDAVITAVLKNGEKVKIDTNLKFVTDAVDADLKEGKFEKAGEYSVAVYAVEERSDLKIGDWIVTVNEK